MSEESKSLNFIEHIVEEDLSNGMSKNDLRFRFPPEPNGYLHIGHTKAIGISFGLGEKYNAPVNLRFDDTNPAKEEQEYVDAIKEDISWLGYQWANELYSSDYFQQLYDWAVQFIKNGKAYVDSQSSEAMADQKGTPTQPGVDGPYRNRSVEENLELFEKMKNGEFAEGEHVLRAKIDMQHTNMLMRDPIMYRVLRKHHHRTGNNWCIYPMYDWAHGESDYIEQISHSLCSLEFKPHRELYDWFLDQVVDADKLRPKQREFARLNLSYTIMSKRKLLKLVEDKIVTGWDDPRMPTISGLRRRGYTPNAIRKFVETIGVAKRDNVIDVALLEFCIREDLNKTAPRVMAVLDPVKLVITNYPEGKEEWLEAENNQEDESAGFRKVPFSRELYIEKEDFKEEAGSKFFRLKLGGEVRLKNAYIIKAENVVKDADGNITEIHCTYSEDTSKKVKGTLHWVSIKHALKAEVREYDRLFMDEAPDAHPDKDFMEFLNPESLKVVTAYVEPSLKDASVGDRFQFQRIGYFNVDKDSTSDALVFNKTVGLRDSWEKQKPVEKQNLNQPKPQNNQPQRKAIDIIQQLGKKYTNLPEEKQLKTKAEIMELAKNVSYDELQPWFNTAAKKVGTRIATMITLNVLLNKGLEKNEEVEAFIKSGQEDSNELLQKEANSI
ncbi:glutamine--tRNA ligase/YqeY domain fusion protein [Subsaxibacter sp. CAU 1640]|uniref:glutamine--tRNA ligase/YqeY domain fusion protein n=1 Tax=Subsaxibacter sp. CAU 1640 TaxID=2933271 RepID=UPI0020048683|nr:glutamine--tRNA ligase/YqeY domain fusion protein [Subsaxibacter sp. CAU 1640]MCK7589493.1 glutamine--tRNA ligase/YqeY domain fusion protein [Subsaxibacter sp. CAU 1640]